jgi:hypothetical protein
MTSRRKPTTSLSVEKLAEIAAAKRKAADALPHLLKKKSF